MYRVIVSNYEERQKVQVLAYLVILVYPSHWYAMYNALCVFTYLSSSYGSPTILFWKYKVE